MKIFEMETQRKDRPNPIFDDGKTFIGEITTYTEAHNLPINEYLVFSIVNV